MHHRKRRIHIKIKTDKRALNFILGVALISLEKDMKSSGGIKGVASSGISEKFNEKSQVQGIKIYLFIPLDSTINISKDILNLLRFQYNNIC